MIDPKISECLIRQRGVFILLLLTSCIHLSAQSYDDKMQVREGNDMYERGVYLHALKDYAEVVERDSTYNKAWYNYANAQYQTKDYEGAINSYTRIAEAYKDTEVEIDIMHNMANATLAQAIVRVDEDKALTGAAGPESIALLEKSIDQYKEALRKQSTAEDSRYNLALAQRILQENLPDPEEQESNQDSGEQDQQEGDQEQQQEGGSQDTPQDQDNQQGEDGPEQEGENGENNDEEQGQGDQRDGEVQEQQEGDGQEQDTQAQQPRLQEPESLSPEEMQRRMHEMQLNKYDQEEIELQNHMARQRMGRSRVHDEKDW